MYLIIQKLAYPTCFSCGSFFQSDHLFCLKCFDLKIAKRVSLKKNTKIENHRFLISWNPGESDLISNYVYALKGVKAKEAWRYYAKDLLNYKDQFKYDFVTPIPSGHLLSKHAKFFGQAVSHFLNIPYLEILEKDSQIKDQKKLSITERQQTQIKQCEQFTITDLENKRILLVDDILTTGSSFKAAKRAIGPAKEVDLLTLFYRETK